VLRIRDVYLGSWILVFTHPGIPDLGSRIQKQQQKRGVKKNLLYFFVVTKIHKVESYFIFEMLKKKKIRQIFKELLKFLPKKLSLIYKNMGLGSGIRDQGSGKNLLRIPDPGVKKASDPGSGTATLVGRNCL
jgi:hypothetical protein